MTGNDVTAPFDGLCVVDLTQGLAGPYCAMLMAQNGANVVKVEPPEGDWSRRLGTSIGPERSAAYVAANRGKRAIVADLKTDIGIGIVRSLVCKADVFMESNRASVADRLGLGYDALRDLNTDLIYLSVTGFGQQGPYANRPATDAILQAFTGLMFSNPDKEGAPKRVEFPIPDYTTGLVAYQTLVTALYGRLRHGGGRHLDVSLMQAMLLFQQQGLISREVDPSPPRGSPLPPTGTYMAVDGYINISIVREKFFQSLCAVLNLPKLAQEERFASIEGRRAHATELLPPIERAISDCKVAELSTAFLEADVPHAIVNDYQDAVRDEHVKKIDSISWQVIKGVAKLPFVNVPGSLPLLENDIRARIPELDGDREEILAEFNVAG